MGSRTTTRVLAAAGCTLAAASAAGLAAAAGTPEPERSPAQAREGLRPLERLAAALPAGRRALQAPAHSVDAVPQRSVGAAIAGRRPVRRRVVFPVVGKVGYGEHAARFGSNRGGREHEGQDMFAPAGAPLRAFQDGVVVETGDDGGRGNYVAIFSPRANQTYVYLHMRDPARHRPGRRVAAGARLGRVGCTGSCWGDHLHFEVRRGRGTQGRPLDPLPLLRRAQRR